MTATWDALNARARGLGTHLLTRSTMAALANAPDLAAFVVLLEAAGIAVPREEGLTPYAIELGIRRAAAAALGRLARWLGGQGGAPGLIFDDEDRRSLRAMVRGAAAGAPAEARLAGLIPTPQLPERALAALARQPRVSDIVALLVTWNHPVGTALLAVAGDTAPDLLRVELELDRWFARRARDAGKHGGGAFRRYVEQSIDGHNARAARLLSASDTEFPADTFLLPGGRGRTQQVFAEQVRRHAGDIAQLDESLLSVRLRALNQEARRDPLGAAPVLAYVLRLRVQTVALQRLLWGTELGVPPAMRAAALDEVA